MTPEAYDRARSDESSRLEVAGLQEKSKIVNTIVGRQKASDPVFLVNGRYLLATDSVTESFQSLNWLIEKLVMQKRRRPSVTRS